MKPVDAPRHGPATSISDGFSSIQAHAVTRYSSDFQPENGDPKVGRRAILWASRENNKFDFKWDHAMEPKAKWVGKKFEKQQCASVNEA